MNTLVVAAHPDDEVLGCGGTVARLTHEGNQVDVAILGEGITSRHPEREQADLAELDALHAQSRQVAELLGVSQIHLFSLPDNRFDTLPLLDIVKIIEDLIERLEPQVVYAQHGGDLNLDHAIVFRAILTATRPTNDCSVKEVCAFEVPSSTEWAFQKYEPIFKPNVFVDITDTLDVKIEAMQLYESEKRLFPHPRSPEALRASALRWGSVAGVEYAEAFELIRSIR